MKYIYQMTTALLAFYLQTPKQTSYVTPGPEVIKLENSLKLKIKSNDWLLADTCLKVHIYKSDFRFKLKKILVASLCRPMGISIRLNTVQSGWSFIM